jgi:hypothetical protein
MENIKNIKNRLLTAALVFLGASASQAQLGTVPVSPDPYGNTIVAGALVQKPTTNTLTSQNTAVGSYTLTVLTNGQFNLVLGSTSAGALLTGSYNIYMANQGSNNDNGVIRIGTFGIQSNLFIPGPICVPGVTGGTTNSITNNIVRVVQTTGWTNTTQFWGVFYSPMTNGVETLYAGGIGTNTIAASGNPAAVTIGGVNSWLMGPGWVVIGTNVTGTFVAEPE